MELTSAQVRYSDFRDLIASMKENKDEKVNYSWREMSLHEAKVFMRCLVTNTKLKWLYLDSVGLNPSSAVHLANALRANHFLEYLNVVNNNLDTKGICLVVKAVEENTTLEELFMGNNIDDAETVGTAAAKALAKTLSINATLRTVGFSENAIGDEGFIAIMEALETNNNVTTVALNQNRVYDQGAESMGSMLAANKSLTKISAMYNHFSEKGSNAIAQSLRNSTKLTYLDLYASFQVATRTYETLLQALEQNKSLIYVGIAKSTGNRKIATYERHVSALLKRNRELQRVAYYSAIAKGAKTQWKRSKLLVVGEGRAGKSSTVHALLNRPFSPEWDSTLGIDITEAKSFGNGRWKSYVPQDFTRQLASNIAIEKLKRKSMNESIKKRNSVSNPQLNLVDVDQDRRGRDVVEDDDEEDEEEVKEKVLTQLHRPYVKGKKRRIFDDKKFNEAMLEYDSLMISIWDYGGQSVFDALHQLFFTTYGVYVVVFDLKELRTSLRRTEKGRRRDKEKGETEPQAQKSLRTWLLTIETFAPNAPVIFVGTRCDEVRDRKSLQMIKNFVSSISGGRQLPFLTIDNKSNTGVATLQERIVNLTIAQDYVNIEVPIRWMACLDELIVKDDNWLSFGEVRKVAESCGIETVEDLENMLIFCTQTGMLLYFNYSENLKQIVTLKPAWLLDCISKIMRDPDLHKFDRAALANEGMLTEVDSYFRTGLISRDLLEYLWGKTESAFLIDLMESLMLLSPSRFNEQFLVPAMAPKLSFEVSGYECLVKFEKNYIPSGLFERLLCAFAEYSSFNKDSPQPKIGRLAAKVWIGGAAQGSAVYLLRKKHVLSLHVSSTEFASKALGLLLSALRRIKNGSGVVSFRWEVLLQAPKRYVPYADAKESRLTPWFRKTTAAGPMDLTEL